MKLHEWQAARREAQTAEGDWEWRRCRTCLVEIYARRGQPMPEHNRTGLFPMVPQRCHGVGEQPEITP